MVFGQGGMTMKNLIIVESPSKAKTIEKYLGGEYHVIASKGHIMDLPKSELGVDVEHEFKPTYVVSEGKKQTIAEMKKDVPEDGFVFIASDPDREGEAIGWHVAQAIGLIDEHGNPKKLKGKQVQLKRIVFHEITKEAIINSFKDARSIDMNLVDAQQARRILDRLVGYKLSPLLWTKIRYGLSAGRVQSVAVRLIVERERERDAFVSKEYWSIDGIFGHTNGDIKAALQKVNQKKIEIGNEEESNGLVDLIKKAEYTVSDVSQKEVRRHPSPPFITSTLQQEANRKLGFSAKQTMSVAQRLYEGVDTPQGRVALITYMRTDSFNLLDQAVSAIRSYIQSTYGNEFAPGTTNVYKKKSKLAQEAHEAIRPVDVAKTPEMMSKYLKKEELKLYDLIWKRTVACQMSDAVFDALAIDILGTVPSSENEFQFRANGQKVKFAGFIKLYFESKDDEDNGNEFLDNPLPQVENGDKVDLKELLPEQHFTQPPARYSEATLVKALEENGIGRPSTYAPIMSTVVDRGYVTKEGKYLKPLDVGYVVNDLLVKHFSDIVDINFTSQIEEEFDEIAEGKEKYEHVLEEFYNPFIANLQTKDKEIKKEDVVILGQSEEKCPECQGAMVIKLGKYGKFLSCANFPTCKGMKSLDEQLNEVTNEVCDLCKSPMVVKINKKGIKFLGCSQYPKCEGTKNIPTGLICDICGADLVQRKSRWGTTFYGCSRYPECKFILKAKKSTDEEGESGKKKPIRSRVSVKSHVKGKTRAKKAS